MPVEKMSYKEMARLVMLTSCECPNCGSILTPSIKWRNATPQDLITWRKIVQNRLFVLNPVEEQIQKEMEIQEQAFATGDTVYLTKIPQLRKEIEEN